MADQNLNALPSGFEFGGYRIERVLGAGGFGITYLARDSKTSRRVAIKEYMPRGIAQRTKGDPSVTPIDSDAEPQFEWGRRRFHREAQTLVLLVHPNIVRTTGMFAAHGTAYIVMEYVDGESLHAVIQRRGRLGAADVQHLLGPLLAGLDAVHDAAYLHRDLKPANIYIRASDGEPVLLDFGAARQAIARHSLRLTAIISDGYSPPEQYGGDRGQAESADIYALGATLYHCIIGERPIAADSRKEAIKSGARDPIILATDSAAAGYAASLLSAIDEALRLVPEQRPQDVAAFSAKVGIDWIAAGRRKEKRDVPDVARDTQTTKPPIVDDAVAKPPPAAGGGRLALGIAATLAIAFVAAAVTMDRDAQKPGDRVVEAKQTPQETAAEAERRAEHARRLEQQRKEDEERKQREEAERQRIDSEVKSRIAQAEEAIRTQDWEVAEKALAEAKRLKPRDQELAALESRIKAAKEAASLLKPGRVFRDCGECPEMVEVPSGSFIMGSAKYQGEDTETPQRRVIFAKPFAIGKYEVTFAEYDACPAARHCAGRRPHDEGWGRGRRPVIDVSWQDAKAYVEWLSRRTGKRYRLPTEAEWEFSARAGSTTRYFWGVDVGRSRVNCVNCSEWSSRSLLFSKGQTAPVGSFEPNRLGLHDLHGNVGEWVEDCWNDKYDGAPTNGGAWLSGECSRRVVRGGSWNHYPSEVTSASRSKGGGIDNRNSYVGFRVVRDL